jgi:hypothetical protein
MDLPGSMKRIALIPPVIADFVYLAVTGVEGVHFLDCSFCPECGGQLTSHDLKRRRFSTVKGSAGPVHIYVHVKRFHCRDCGRLCYANAPFYEKSRFGSPVVDLCLAFSKEYTYTQTAEILNNLGIIIDRGTVRKTVLAHSHEVEVADLFGICLPRSVLSLSALMTGYDSTKPVSGREVLQACGFTVSL